MAKLSRGGKSIASIPKSILYNRYLLYFIFAIALGNVVQLMTQQDHMSVVIMVIVGLLTSFFSKNMVVILCIALVVTNILKYGTKLRVEGFETSEEEETGESGERQERKRKRKRKRKPLLQNHSRRKAKTNNKYMILL